MMKGYPNKTLLTRQEAAELVRVNAAQVAWWERDGLQPDARTGHGEPLYAPETITQFAKQAKRRA